VQVWGYGWVCFFGLVFWFEVGIFLVEIVKVVLAFLVLFGFRFSFVFCGVGGF